MDYTVLIFQIFKFESFQILKFGICNVENIEISIRPNLDFGHSIHANLV